MRACNAVASFGVKTHGSGSLSCSLLNWSSANPSGVCSSPSRSATIVIGSGALPNSINQTDGGPPDQPYPSDFRGADQRKINKVASPVFPLGNDIRSGGGKIVGEELIGHADLPGAARSKPQGKWKV